MTSEKRDLIKKDSNSKLQVAVRNPHAQSKDLLLRHTMTTPIVGVSRTGNLQLTIPKTSLPSSSSSLVKDAVESQKFRVPGRPQITLEEDEYISGLEKIITRDFFPDADPNGIATATAPKEKLNAFQQKYTSEDNSSFNNILESNVQSSRDQKPWFWKEETVGGKLNKAEARKQQQLQLTSYDHAFKEQIKQENLAISKALGWSDERKRDVDTWNSEGPTNGVFFYPEHHQTGLTEKQISDQAAKKIVYQNTRFSSFSRVKHVNTKESPKIDTSAVSGSSAQQQPLVNGYPFVTERTYEKEDSSAAKPPSSEGFSMQSVPEKEIVRDRLIERKMKVRRQERLAAMGSAGQISRIGKQSNATPLSSAACSILQSIRSNKERSADFSIMSTPLRRPGATPKRIDSPVIVKKKR